MEAATSYRNLLPISEQTPGDIPKISLPVFLVALLYRREREVLDRHAVLWWLVAPKPQGVLALLEG